jgi:hypothetical protein
MKHKTKMDVKSPVMSGFLELPEVAFNISFWCDYRYMLFPSCCRLLIRIETVSTVLFINRCTSGLEIGE